MIAGLNALADVAGAPPSFAGGGAVVGVARELVYDWSTGSQYLLSELDWRAIFFYIALFALVGGLEKVHAGDVSLRRAAGRPAS